jgi:drug/metabolite transporter (DMT)-like permease/transcription elongation GreA/GreB family factor
MEKSKLLNAVISQLEEELIRARAAHAATTEAATAEENRPENQYDTRALEASFLARGQAARISELEHGIKVLQTLPMKDFDGGTQIQGGALVTVECEEVKQKHFVLPVGAGISVPDGKEKISVVTYSSPLGSALLGKTEGETFVFQRAGAKRIRYPEREVSTRLGLLWALLSAASFGLMSYLVHWNPQKFPVEQMAFLRGLITMAGVLPFCWRELPKYFRGDALMLWVRAFSGCTGLFLYYFTLQGTVSANANFLFSSSPLFVCLFSVLVLREKLSRREAFGIGLIVLAGVILYIPNRASMPLWVWQTGIAGAVVSAVAFLSLGSAAKKYSSALIVFGFGFMTTVLSAVYPGWTWQPTTGAFDWSYLLLTGLLGLGAQFFMTLSFIHLKSSIAAALGRSSILFAGLLDITLAGYQPHWLEWLSYLTIVAGVYLSQHGAQKKPVDV